MTGRKCKVNLDSLFEQPQPKMSKKRKIVDAIDDSLLQMMAQGKPSVFGGMQCSNGHCSGCLMAHPKSHFIWQNAWADKDPDQMFGKAPSLNRLSNNEEGKDSPPPQPLVECHFSQRRLWPSTYATSHEI